MSPFGALFVSFLLQLSSAAQHFTAYISDDLFNQFTINSLICSPFWKYCSLWSVARGDSPLRSSPRYATECLANLINEIILLIQ